MGKATSTEDLSLVFLNIFIAIRTSMHVLPYFWFGTRTYFDMQLYEQKYKLKTLRSNQFIDDAAEEEEHLKSNDVELAQRICIKESLTKENRELLKLTSEEA